jgi:phosphonate transport system substrate-binding protein
MTMTTRRELIRGGAAVAAAGWWLRPAPAAGSDWRGIFPELNFGVISSENEADRVARHQKFLAYMERTLRTKLRMHNATDYAGTIEGLKARKLEFARFGPASYAQAWLVTGGKVEPMAVQTDSDGFAGYHAVIVVKTDSPYRRVEDLQGKSVAFADPNSTSGYLAPRYFLKEAGFDPTTHFGRTGFAGSHENGVIAAINGTYDAAATWWTNEERSNVQRMEGKKLIPPGQVRVVWKSPKLPESPWAIHTDLPSDLRLDVRTTLLGLPAGDPAAWRDLTDGKSTGLIPISHADYEPIVRMVQATQRDRRGR